MANTAGPMLNDGEDAEQDFSGPVTDAEAPAVLRRLQADPPPVSFGSFEQVVAHHLREIREEQDIKKLEGISETSADVKFAELDLSPEAVARVKKVHAEWLQWNKAHRKDRYVHTPRSVLTLDGLAGLLNKDTANLIMGLNSPKLYGVNDSGELLFGSGEADLSEKFYAEGGPDYDTALRHAQGKNYDLMDEWELASFAGRWSVPGRDQVISTWLKTPGRKKRSELGADEKGDWLKFSKAKVGTVKGYMHDTDPTGDVGVDSLVPTNSVYVRLEYADLESARIGGVNAMGPHQLDLLSPPEAKDLYGKIGARVVLRIPTNLGREYRTPSCLSATRQWREDQLKRHEASLAAGHSVMVT